MLGSHGHDVAIIDQDASAFRRLGTSFEGQTVTGIGFDRDTLTAAGIKGAYAFAAVSSGDNSNILAARVARETFGVEHVAARIYDPQRAAVYQRLGIPTVATVKWTADQMIQRLLPSGAMPELTDPSGQVVVAEVPLAEEWIGRSLTDVEARTGARVAYITRLGHGDTPSSRHRGPAGRPRPPGSHARRPRAGRAHLRPATRAPLTIVRAPSPSRT